MMYLFFFIRSRNMISIFTLQSTPQSHHIFNLCKLNAINVVVSIVSKRIHNCNSICRFNSVTKASVKRLTICRIHNQIKSFAWITFLRFFVLIVEHKQTCTLAINACVACSTCSIWLFV